MACKTIRSETKLKSLFISVFIVLCWTVFEHFQSTKGILNDFFSSVYIYIYIYVCVCVCERERENERERERERERESVCVCVYVYVYSEQRRK